MNGSLHDLLAELEQFGEVNDQANAERARRMNNITRDTGEFLALIVLATSARRVLEIGTSNGYSTLWLGSAARTLGGRVTTVELSDYKIGLARETIRRSGLETSIHSIQEDAGRLLERIGEASFDLVFLDSDRSKYVAWWPHVKRVLRPGGLLVVDNATSHTDEMAPLMEIVRADEEFTTCLATIGKGEFLAVRVGT